MARCKKCRVEFSQTKFLQKFCGTNIDCKTAEGLHNLDLKKKKDKKKFNDFKEKVRPRSHSKENKKNLQAEVNKLARMIDARYRYVTCIDCDKPFKKIDAGHFKSVGSNPSLRFNLHNIHSQAYECNRNGLGGGKSLGYFRGLEKRYGSNYADYVENGIQKEYLYIGLSDQEIYDKLKLVRALVRQFDTYKFYDSIHARNMFNTLIGIYERKYLNKQKQKK
tara:strand:+ start:3273 stop:3935 length:663 start_codon:yes stop_codon:yes gene_type:complete